MIRAHLDDRKEIGPIDTDGAVCPFPQTYYAKRYDSFKVDTLESMYAAIMKHILSSESRQDPYSVATIYSYLYHKEHEVNRLIIALECVRYRISADEAMQHIAKTEYTGRCTH